MDGRKSRKRGPKKGQARNARRWDTVKLQERENQALRYRLAGLTFDAVGSAMDPKCTGSAARKMIHRALARERVGISEDVRELELLRLDRLMRRPFIAATSDKTPLADVPALNQAVVVLMTRRAKLLGLDSAVEIRLTDAVREILDVVRSHVTGQTFEAITAEIARRGGLVGAGEGAGAGEAQESAAEPEPGS